MDFIKATHKYNNYLMFIELFECVQIRSMSEAMAETVGSIMNINSGTGRQLEPVNFSAEIYLRFNLGPLHRLTGFIKEVALKHGKEFFRKEIPRALNVKETSAAIRSFRQKEESKSHIPYNIFEYICRYCLNCIHFLVC